VSVVGAAVAVGLLAGVPEGLAQAPDWAVGRWKGTVEGQQNSKDGPDRVLIVAADGKCQWGFPRTANPDPAKCTISAGGVELVTSANSAVSLKRAGDRLDGTISFPGNTRRGVSLTRQ
jgi:hypothetical protein